MKLVITLVPAGQLTLSGAVPLIAGRFTLNWFVTIV
jgi:hypothetical protein